MNNSDSIDYIEHTAVVKSVDARKDSVKVAVSDANECDSCPAARLCGGATTKELIEIITPKAGSFREGENVLIKGTEQMEKRAIMLATVIPCICLVAIMVLVYLLTGNQGIAAVCGIGAMSFFFLMLYIFRNKVAHEFVFTISKIHND